MVKSEWTPGCLGDVIESFDAGVSVNSGTSSSSNQYVLKTSAVAKGKLTISEKKPVLPSEIFRLKCCLRKDSILFSRMNTPELVGECAYVPQDYSNIFLPDRIWQAQFKPDAHLNAKWLNYVLCSPRYKSLIKSCATGTSSSMKNISKKQLLFIEIDYPTYEEQTVIANALSDIDDLISNLEKLIAKKKAIKQGAMQELLTGKRRLPGFVGAWEKVRVDGICRFINGGTPSKSNTDWWNGTIPWISSSDIALNDIHSVSISRYITQDAIDHSATKLCPAGSVLVVSRVGVGKVAVSPCELCTSQDFTNLMPYGHNPHYLAYRLLGIMKEKAKQVQGTSIKGITVDDIGNIEFLSPTEDEQLAIVTVLHEMDTEIELLIKKLAKARAMKSGMMSELLTGRIRLI